MNDDRGPVLLALARASIASALGQTCFVDQSAPWLREKGACFVTLKQGGELRGCVGHIEPRRSLLEAVTAVARAAAFEDRRFPPLTPVNWRLPASRFPCFRRWSPWRPFRKRRR